MTDGRRALLLFEQTIVLDAAVRRDFLDSECGGDTALRNEIEALLRADADSGEFLEQPFGAGRDRSGERLGPYRLLELIGNGGMGSVYRGERADGAYSKIVAIKLLLYDAGDLRTRFALEQRILGALSHVHIASLLDVGSDANGAPYLVMEYVEGESITSYVQHHALNVPARLAMFVKILDAVQTAHGQLIVHRDIKPNNVLVDEHGEPKLLDFGIAKLIDESAASHTRTGIGPLTPEYASPEQVRGEPLGTASDIYSLGILLFELLTGQRPYRIVDTRPSSIERTVCEIDPPRPSTQMITRQICGSARDLDGVVLKALAKLPAKRYASCAMFAEDIRRWLNGEQVLARHPPWTERTMRRLRRYRLAVSVAATAALTLLVGSGFALWQAHEARMARDRAERINHFLTGMLASADPGDLGRKATVVDVLDRAQHQTELELADDPLTTASTELTLAKTYAALGELDAARHAGELGLTAAQHADDANATIEAQTELGDILNGLGEFERAEELLHDARSAAAQDGSMRQRGDVANSLGSLEDARGNYNLAEQWFKTALNELPADADSARGETLNNLGIVESYLGDDAAALTLHQQSAQLLRKAYPHGHPRLAQALGNLADSQHANGDKALSKKTYAEALAMQIDLVGPDHQMVVSTLSSMGVIALADNDTVAALEYGTRAWAAGEKLSEENPISAYAAVVYGQALLRASRTQEAIVLIQTALRLRKKTLAPDHPLIANTESVLGLAEALSGDVTDGEAMARSAYEHQLAKLGAQHTLTKSAKDRLEQITALKNNNN